VIRYEHGPGERPAHAGAPAGDWIRLIPFALAYPRVVVSTRAERDGFVYLDDVYDLKLTGDEDLLGRGPNLLVSDDFVRAYRAGGFEGLALHEAQHATPHTIRVRRPWRCRPTHHATAVTERVVLVPATHPKGRPYGHHGRPSEPLEILAPAPAAGRFFGGPWFATASLPFQPLIAPAGFLASFRATVGREPSFGWADVSIIADDTAALVPRGERFDPPSTAASAPGYASFAEALDAARREAPTRAHVIVGADRRPERIPRSAWPELGAVAGSTFFGGAFGLFPATEEVALSHAEAVELGYPFEPDWVVVGWFAGEQRGLVAVTPEGHVRRGEASGELNLHYTSFGDFFADVMADLVWAHDHGRYGWQWLGA